MIAKPAMLMSALCLSLLVGGVSAAATPPTNNDVSTHAGTAISAALRPALYKALAHDAEQAYAIDKNGCAALRKQQLKGCFTADGVRLDGTDARPLALQLTAWGRGAALHSISTVEPAIAGNRVSYAHGALTEWWQVLPIGFEQGFTIAKRPSGHGDLALALAASEKPQADHGELTFGKLRYGDLVVTDATGRVVPSRLAMQDGRIRIAVNDAGARYPLTVDPLVWIEQEVTAGDIQTNKDFFGFTVAREGSTAFIGAFGSNVGGHTGQGAVYVFTESNGTWNHTSTLIASDGSVDDYFGFWVSISGNTALIGAPFANIGSNLRQGAAYIFTESGGTWTQTQKLTASDGASTDQFGRQVALSGNTALIGAPYADIGNKPNQGAAYIFTESGGTWTQTQKLTASDGTAGDRFGRELDLLDSTALVGAPYANINGNINQGAAYVFTESGGTWTQTQKLTASDGGEKDLFGRQDALSGNTALIGAEQADVGGNQLQGAAYVFTESNGTWTQTQKLTASDGAAGDYFGREVALSGTTAIVGAPFASVGGNAGQGAAYLFTESGGTWTQTTKLTASDGAANDQFSRSVALDGTIAMVGAPFAAIGGNADQGKAYFYGNTDLDLAVSAPASATQGGNFTSQVIATNSSSAASPAVAVTAAVPAGADFVSANATQGSCSQDSGIVSCDFGPIDGNGGTATANVTLKASGNAGDTVENTASVSQATPEVTASAPTQIESSGGGGGGGSSGGGGGATSPLSLALFALLSLVALARRRT